MSASVPVPRKHAGRCPRLRALGLPVLFLQQGVALGSARAHGHVQREQAVAKFWLRPLALASSSGFRSYELRRIESLVVEHSERFEEAWREFFTS